MPAILAAALAVFWAVQLAAADEARMTQVSDTVIEISGGTGKEAWRLRYARVPADPFQRHFVTSEGNRAWYAYGGWLRLIDTQKGVVIGRWHYPAEIVSLTPEGTKIQIETEDRYDARFRRKMELDPSDPKVPFWPTNFLMLYRVSLYEAAPLWPVDLRGEGHSITGEEAKRIIPEIEEAVQRDPYSLWSRVALGKALKDAGDPRATEAFQRAIATPSADYTELLPLARFLDVIGENDLARKAFSQGYQDFWQRGNDPRMLKALVVLLTLYAPTGPDRGNPATPHGRELVERAYSLDPWGEGVLAWRLYADYLGAHGPSEEAKIWRARAEVSYENGVTFSDPEDHTDFFLIMLVSAGLALVLYALVLLARYRPQRRLDLAARNRAAGHSLKFGPEATSYWSSRERFAFFSIALIGWISLGLTEESLAALLRRAGQPISAVAGSYAGPVTTDYFEHKLPATPQRDLMLAVAYQQDGQTERAEGLYRSLPQFAESWNNLGVILKQEGKEQDARSAFERALQLDPKMAEAGLNLGRPPIDFWTEQHQKYLPGQPMIAPLRGRVLRPAFLGGSPALVGLRALEGPFLVGNVDFDFGVLHVLIE